ncbi:Npt1/Npt2 family nucleotide transporter [Candidatus Similichlamydia laticola]|uniref:ADP,ATP carrier protein n=1 Tax=Candidatus Similichlamydia laticola TaxID=2170265 RepID=A0A369KJB3_9BACT|nr:Npt1/Npt2 family nucleotide transporter [Candidatus Similichlamydia laticola]RDB31873.1 ADP/ATP Translocase, NTT1 [Candidatus Similichlamydia laticola]
MFWKFASIACLVCVVSISSYGRRALKWLRLRFWPIQREEVGIVLPLLGVLFLIAFNYYALKSVKDTLVITSAGATAIPFIKTWALLPITCLSSYLFALLSIRTGSRRAFLIILSSFLGFYSLFTFILYPYRKALLFHGLANWLEPLLPEGFQAIPILIRHWTFTLFYLISELWSVIILNVCFWGFLNEVVSVDQAKRLYPILRTGLNTAGILSGHIGLHFARAPYNPCFPMGETAWDQALIKTLLVVLLAGLGIFALFLYISSKIETVKCQAQEVTPKISLWKEGHLLVTSRTILCLSCITFAFNFLLNTTEMLLSTQVYKLFSDPINFSSYMHRLAIITSVIASLSSFFLSGNLLRNLSWFSTALITPCISLITSFFFFLFLFFPEQTAHSTAWFGLSPLEATVLFGTAQNCLVRSFKSSLFDINKDLALIELGKSMRVRGKAVIDGIAARTGKAFASVSITFLLGLLGSIDACTGPLGILNCFVIGSWFSATYVLDRHRLAKVKKKVSKLEND